MRRHEQLSPDRPWIEHNHADELAQISQILTLHPGMSELVEQDLMRGLKRHLADSAVGQVWPGPE